MKNTHGRTCKKTKVYIYLYISPYENVSENGCIYIYTAVFKNVFIWRDTIYRYIYTFVFLHVRPCVFFTCHCPTCEKSRCNENFSLCRVLCFTLKRKCCFDLFFCLKNAFAFQYRFAMANYLACFGNEETSPRSSRVIRRHPKNDF